MMKSRVLAIAAVSMPLWLLSSGCIQPLPAAAANPEQVQRLLKTNQCPLCDLSGANLESANLFGANLVNANLKGANLSGANLGSANLSDADLTGANLTRAYLYLSILETTNLSQADLSGAYLKDAVLTNTTLKGANLSGVNLSRTNLSGVNLQGADLRGANLSDAILTGLRPQGTARQAEALLAFGYGGSLSKQLCTSPLDDRALESARQSGFDIAVADLSGANLSGANLSGAMLASGRLMGANLSSADLTDACLNYSKLNNAVLDNANLQGATLNQAILEGASLKGVKNADLAGAVRSQAEATARPVQTEAKQIVSSMNRAEQAYYLEYAKFASTLKELGLGIRPETEHYLYRIFLYPDRTRAAMLAGIPKSSGFKTYIGFVNITKLLPSKEETSMATLCESEDAKPLLPKLPTTLPKTGTIPCPEGFKRLN